MFSLSQLLSFSRHRAFANIPHAKIQLSTKAVNRRSGFKQHQSIANSSGRAAIAEAARHQNQKSDNRLFHQQVAFRSAAADLSTGRSTPDRMKAAREALMISESARRRRKSQKSNHYREAAFLNKIQAQDYRNNTRPWGF